MRSTKTIRSAASGACLVAALAFSGCGGATDANGEETGQVQSAYVEDPEPGPLQWICDLPIETHWSIYAPNQEEEYMNECYAHTDYDASVACYQRSGKPCCMTNTYHSHSVTWANQTWYCGAYWMAW